MRRSGRGKGASLSCERFLGVFDGECSGKGRFFVEKSPALPVRKMAGAFREVQRAEITVKESVASILS